MILRTVKTCLDVPVALAGARRDLVADCAECLEKMGYAVHSGRWKEEREKSPVRMGVIWGCSDMGVAAQGVEL